MDTNPLAADPRIVIAEQKAEFALGLSALEKLTKGHVYVCQSEGENLAKETAQIEIARFGGKHPAGLAGTHIHHLDPVTATKTVWSIGYQDVIAFGKLFATGKLDASRVIALAGPQVVKPRLVRTTLGASLEQLTAGELEEGVNRIVSGSVLGGRTAEGTTAFLSLR
jgi:Na+-transporting NADH:ubiquinone oxidoreductase subunit A